MKEGTRSFLFGCHQFVVHPVTVLLAWKRHFGSWPKIWQIVCIFIHDVGIVGMDYLSETKEGHWTRGAVWAYRLFGWRGFEFCAGHTTEYIRGNEDYRSDLFWADKKAQLIVPMCWLRWVYWIEGFGEGGLLSPERWRELVKEDLESEKPRSGHELYLEESRNKDSGGGG